MSPVTTTKFGAAAFERARPSAPPAARCQTADVQIAQLRDAVTVELRRKPGNDELELTRRHPSSPNEHAPHREGQSSAMSAQRKRGGQLGSGPCAIISTRLHERIHRDRNARAERRTPVREVGLLDEVKLDDRPRPIEKELAQPEHESESQRKRQSRTRKPGRGRAQHPHQLGRRQSERQVRDRGDEKDDPHEA